MLNEGIIEGIFFLQPFLREYFPKRHPHVVEGYTGKKCQTSG
jgi:hypothetical protein